jgi:integrase/recombinase XerD
VSIKPSCFTYGSCHRARWRSVWAALRFFYTKTLKKGWSIAETPYPKKDHRLPTILSQEEVAQLIDAASTVFHRTLLMTLYATGARNAEVTRLEFSDVDSKRMVIHIRGGKGPILGMMVKIVLSLAFN